MNPYNHISPDLRDAMELTGKERMRLTEQPVWIPYPTATSILHRLEELLHLLKQPRMPCLLIIGEPNSGKTTIIREFCKMHGEGWVNENNDPVKPVILTEAPPSADQKSLYISLLERFHAPYRATTHPIDLCNQTIHLIEKCQARMLIFDEFHSLLAASGKKLTGVLNAIRLLCNKLEIPIVGVGIEEARTVFSNDAQLMSRFGIVELHLWERNAQFRRLLIALEETLLLKKPSNLQQPELAQLLHEHSGGNLGDLRRLLIECAKAAIASGAERIDKDLIQSTAKNNPWRRSNGIRGQEA